MEAGERKYKNKDITVYWKASSCIHASTCINELPTVFRTNKKPWIRMEGGSTDEIIETVDRCPVDALTWKYNELDKNDSIGIEHANHVKNRRKTLLRDDSEYDKAISVKVMKDGPFVINGSFYLERETGVKTKFNGTVSVCRCGLTKLPPFCDGSHRAG
jgi:uncharacterized Fe-S cluster protein YjdI